MMDATGLPRLKYVRTAYLIPDHTFYAQSQIGRKIGAYLIFIIIN